MTTCQRTDEVLRLLADTQRASLREQVAIMVSEIARAERTVNVGNAYLLELEKRDAAAAVVKG